MPFQDLIQKLEAARHPSPVDDIDPIGPLLRDLDNSVTELQLVDAHRLRGDRVTIDSALLALKLVQERIDRAEKEYRLQAAE